MSVIWNVLSRPSWITKNCPTYFWSRVARVVGTHSNILTSDRDNEKISWPVHHRASTRRLLLTRSRMNQFIQYNNLTANDEPHRGWTAAWVRGSWSAQVDCLSLTSFDNSRWGEWSAYNEHKINVGLLSCWTMFTTVRRCCLLERCFCTSASVRPWSWYRTVSFDSAKSTSSLSGDRRLFSDITIVAHRLARPVWPRRDAPDKATTDRPSTGHGLRRSIRSARSDRHMNKSGNNNLSSVNERT